MKRLLSALIVMAICVSTTQVTRADVTFAAFARLNIPVGIATDNQGNVYAQAADTGIIKFSPDGQPILQFATDIIIPGHIAFDNSTNQLWSVVGAIATVYDIDSGNRLTAFDIRSLPIDVTHVYDIEAAAQSPNYQGSSDFSLSLNPQQARYGDIALFRRGNQLDVFVTGIYAIVTTFVARLRFVDDQFQSGQVIATSSSAGGIAGAPSEPRGVAVNPQGIMLTSLPLAVGGETGLFAYDRAYSFSVDFPEQGEKPQPLFDGMPDFIGPATVTSVGMTSDAAGNFYVAGSSDLGALCLVKGFQIAIGDSPILVISADGSSLLACLPTTGSPQDIATDPDNRFAYATNSTSGDVFRYSLTLANATTQITPEAGGAITIDESGFRLLFPTAAVPTPVAGIISLFLGSSRPLALGTTPLRVFRLTFDTDGNAQAQTLNKDAPFVLAQPATLTLKYTDEELAQRDIDESSLHLLVLEDEMWQSVPFSLDQNGNIVTASIDRATEYALAGGVSGSQGAAKPKVRLSKPAFVTVTQIASPNVLVRQGDTITYTISIVNRGEGSAKQVIMSMPFDPTSIQVVDAYFSRDDSWVSNVMSDSLELQIGRLSSRGDVVTATVRLRVLAEAPEDTVVNGRITYRWRDDRSGGNGRSNVIALLVAEQSTSSPYSSLKVQTDNSSAPNTYIFDGNMFLPGEVVAIWYNTPEGKVIALPSQKADGNGAIQTTLRIDEPIIGHYSMVARGNWSGITAVGMFQVQ